MNQAGDEPEMDENGYPVSPTVDARRSEYVKAGDELQALIERGAWNYPLDQFQKEFAAFKSPDHTTIIIVSGVITFVMAMVFMGIIWAVIVSAAFIFQFVLLERTKSLRNAFTQNADRYLAGNIAQKTPNPASQVSASATDEIAKLYSLLKAGALTEAEYQEAKRKVLEKAA